MEYIEKSLEWKIYTFYGKLYYFGFGANSNFNLNWDFWAVSNDTLLDPVSDLDQKIQISCFLIHKKQLEMGFVKAFDQFFNSLIKLL